MRIPSIHKHVLSNSSQEQRRPAWISEMVEDLCDSLEPLIGSGRVGFQARLVKEKWSLTLFMGRKEIVGGPRDGSEVYVNFQVDLLQILKKFESVERCEWIALPDLFGSLGTTLQLSGFWKSNPVTVQIRQTPPSIVGPGIRELWDGTCEMA